MVLKNKINATINPTLRQDPINHLDLLRHNLVAHCLTHIHSDFCDLSLEKYSVRMSFHTVVHINHITLR